MSRASFRSRVRSLLPGSPGHSPGVGTELSGSAFGFVPLVVQPKESTPLSIDESECEIPAPLLWAMKSQCHCARHRVEGDGERVRRQLGVGGEALGVIDDGSDHAVIGRVVGTTSDGLTYCLTGRTSAEDVSAMTSGAAPIHDALRRASDLTLLSVYTATDASLASNVVTIQHYRHVGDVPADYLPPNPPIEFADDRTDPGG